MDAGTEKTMPRAGLVSQIRQNWSVFEDQALAQQIQQQEISQHLIGNRNRNQILREDIPQAKKEQSLEEVQASLEYRDYRQRLDEVAHRDAVMAEELTRKQESRLMAGNDAQYVAARDEAFARNLQRIEREYRERQERGQPAAHSRQISEPHRGQAVSSHHTRTSSQLTTHDNTRHVPGQRDVTFHELGGGLQYNDDQYLVQVARPAMVTDEPVYMNNPSPGTPGGQYSLDSLPPPTPFRGEPSKQLTEQSGHNSSAEYPRRPRDNREAHNVSSEFSGGRSSQSSSRSRSSLASTSPSEVLGACGGAPLASSDLVTSSLTSPDPDSVLGLGSALSPAEIRAAEAAERLLEQERKDREIAKQLQEQFSITEGDHSDRKLAIEAQDHEFAKILQAKEKAKAKRAREKARQRKLDRERQRQEETEEDDPDAISRAPERPGTSGSHHRDPDLERSLSPRSPDLKPPSRRPVIHEGAIDSHVNDTYCTRQITPAHSESEESEPRYANIRKNGDPVMEEPILAIKKSKKAGGKSEAAPAVPLEDIPAPPYMPMQSSTSKKSASLERRIKKKKEKEGCKQQ